MVNGGRYTGTVVNQYTIASTETLIFVIPDYYLPDNNGIDSVLISAVNASATPEPGTWGLFSAGIAALADIGDGFGASRGRDLKGWFPRLLRSLAGTFFLDLLPVAARRSGYSAMPHSGNGTGQFPRDQVLHEQPGIALRPAHLVSHFVDRPVKAIMNHAASNQDVYYFAF